MRSWTRSIGCSTAAAGRQTALKKLQKLRRRVRRFKRLGKALDKLKSPTLEKALVFLDDKLAGSDQQRGGAGQPPFPQGPEERIFGAYGRSRSAVAWPWTCTANRVPVAVLKP